MERTCIIINGVNPKTNIVEPVSVIPTPQEITDKIMNSSLKNRKDLYIEFLDKKLFEEKENLNSNKISLKDYNDWEDIIYEQKEQLEFLKDLSFDII